GVTPPRLIRGTHYCTVRRSVTADTPAETPLAAELVAQSQRAILLGQRPRTAAEQPLGGGGRAIASVDRSGDSLLVSSSLATKDFVRISNDQEITGKFRQQAHGDAYTDADDAAGKEEEALARYQRRVRGSRAQDLSIAVCVARQAAPQRCSER